MSTVARSPTQRSCPQPPRVTAACGTCRRRKERCDGQKPCCRCIKRGVEASCSFASRKPRTRNRKTRSTFGPDPTLPKPGLSAVSSLSTACSSNLDDVPMTSHGTHLPPSAGKWPQGICPWRLNPIFVNDRHGRPRFIGESANLSFLHALRNLFNQRVGSCSIVDDSLDHGIYEGLSECQPDWSDESAQYDTPNLSLQEAERLLNRYYLATSQLLVLFRTEELSCDLRIWIEGCQAGGSSLSPILYVILAIGAQADQQDNDKLAASLFARGCYLANRSWTNEPSIETVQAVVLIAFYLLGASQHNAAFVYLGMAVRAAYTIGLHRKVTTSAVSQQEFEGRERTWTCLRILDLSMSALLGRPPSTSETRDTESALQYCASLDLCHIGEKILTQVYHPRQATDEILVSIAAHHSRWAARFRGEFATVSRAPTADADDTAIPNIGLLHVQGAYYWTIIVLTAPLLIDSVTLHIEKTADTSTIDAEEYYVTQDTSTVWLDACIDSAMCTVDLVYILKGCRAAPKRLPFVTNSLLLAAVVLGIAYVGDMYLELPLDRYLSLSRELLSQFTSDQTAQRAAEVVGFIQEACASHKLECSSYQLQARSLVMQKLFGSAYSAFASMQEENINNESSFEEELVNTNARRQITNGSGIGTMKKQSAVPTTQEYATTAINGDLDLNNLQWPSMSPLLSWDHLDDQLTPFWGNYTDALLERTEEWL